MYPPEFDYRRAGSVEEALELLAASEDARILAGGQSMVPELKTGRANPGTLVDVGGLDDLRGIEAGDGTTTVGALTTYATLADSDHLWSHAPALAEAAAELGDRQVRNRGTVGGNLAQADPDGDLPAATLTVDATVVVRSRDGEREIAAGEFFVDDGETAIGDDELVSAVRIPHAGGIGGPQAEEVGEAHGGAYVKKAHPATGYATVGVAAVVSVSDGEVADARVAANGVQSRPVRLRAVETGLAGEPATGEAIERAAVRAGDDLDPDEIPSDPYASGQYRANVLETYAGRAVGRAVERARGDVAGADGGGRR